MKRIAVAAVALLALTGCTLIPDYERPKIEAPAAWQGELAQGQIDREWWKEFNSPELDSMMQEAFEHNHDLKASVARIAQARAAVRIAGADLYPSLSATAATSHAQPNGRLAGSYDSSWRAGTGIAYELDLFGANRAAVVASEAQYQGAEYDSAAIRLVLMADVAQTYFNVINARDRLAIADDNLRLAGDILAMVEARFSAGADSALEVAQQKSAVETARAARASLEANLKVYENSLAVLLGYAPGQRPVTGGHLGLLTVPIQQGGVPSSLLERRPDIRAAEASLIAANANIGVAKAALYPSVSLGLDWSVAASSFADPAKSALSLASSLTAPIFSAGRLEGGIEQATARQAELLEAYRQSVLTAFKEVEDALAAVRAAQLRETALSAAQKEAQVSYDLSQARYKAGTIDFQTLLNTQTQLFQAKDSFLQTRYERLAASVNLYKALGGGWYEKSE